MSVTDETLAQIYKIAPKMEDYRTLSGSRYWLPYVMRVAYPNLKSPTYSTDNLGLRHTVTESGLNISLGNRPSGKISLIVGGSTAFGVGSTSDANTISSELSHLTGSPWLNYGITSHTVTQNLVHFVLHQHLMEPVENIVLLIGRNEICTFIKSIIYPTVYGTFSWFTEIMNALNPGFVNRESGVFNFPIQYLDSGAFQVVKDITEDQDMLINHLKGVFSGFRTLARGIDSRLTIAVQPVVGWHRRQFSTEEEELLSLYPRISKVKGLYDIHASAYNDWYGQSLRRISEELAIDFCDLNQVLEAD